MGLFDWVHYGDHKDYQTKSLDNSMCQYEIRDGILFKEQAEYVWIENDSRFGGYLEKKNAHWVPQYQFSGEVYFYRNIDKTYKVWDEYTAFFIDGKLVKIVNEGYRNVGNHT